jgi:hypothetical protein
VATYTYNGIAGGQSYTIANNNGTFVGVQGDSLSGGYVDNIYFKLTTSPPTTQPGLVWTSYTANAPTQSGTSSYTNYISFFNNPGTIAQTGTTTILQINGATGQIQTPTLASFGSNSYVAIKFSGFFCPNQSGSWTFSVLSGTVALWPDDAAILFLGPPSSTITPNSTFSSVSTTPSSTLPIIYNIYQNNYSSIQTVTGLVAGQYYPILLYYAQTLGGYSVGLSFQAGTGTGTYITDFTGYITTTIP